MERPKSDNIPWHHATVTRARREKLNRHRAVVLWFTGLSGAGKSTLAHAVEEALHRRGCRTFVFDGDNVRHGLNRDLGFSVEDRAENLRRIGEMCKLFAEAGVLSFAAFVSPYREERRKLRAMFPEGDFVEVFCDCSLDVCEARDVKGHYRRARAGEIAEFTGISAPYERPDDAELILRTGEESLEECVARVLSYLEDREIIGRNG